MNGSDVGPEISGSTRHSVPGGPAATGPMMAVIERLAAGDFEGRRVGTPGGHAAARWLADHLAGLGAAATLDEFTVAGAVKQLSATPILRWHDEHGDRNLVHRRDFAEHLASAHSPAVRHGRLAVAGDDIDGAWVLLDGFSAAEIDALATSGAAGVLVPRGTDAAGWMPKTIAGPAGRALPVVSVRTDLHRRMRNSVPDGRSSVSAAVPLETVDVDGVNVHAVFRRPHGGGDGLSVLLTAHYDGVGDDPERHFPAAADNASGVAVVIESATRLHRILPDDVGLAVALLDAEEAGAHGSAHHAPRLAPNTTVINVDGAAALHEAAAVEAGGPAHALLAALDIAGRRTRVPLRAQAMPSDNRRYAAAGLSAIGIGMGIPGYQTPAETPDRIEPSTLSAAVRLVTTTVIELVAQPRRAEAAPARTSGTQEA